VAALAHAPGILDFYIWLVWRSWTVNGSPAYVPLFTASGLCTQLGTTDYPARRFRQLIGQWLRRVKTLWPQCPADIAPDGNCLIVRSSRSVPAITTVEKSLTPAPANTCVCVRQIPQIRDLVYTGT
jgi:hypothetical protein